MPDAGTDEDGEHVLQLPGSGNHFVIEEWTPLGGSVTVVKKKA